MGVSQLDTDTADSPREYGEVHHASSGDGHFGLLRKRSRLELEFQAKRTALREHLSKRPAHIDPDYDKALSSHTSALRQVSRQLLFIYQHLGSSHSKAKEVRAVLLICDIADGDKKEITEEEEAQLLPDQTAKSLSDRIRKTTGEYNWYRLFFLRGKRFFEALAPVIKAINGYHGFEDFVNGIDMLNPALSYIAWLYYVPRLLTNVILLLKHTLYGPWMNPYEAEVVWWKRLQAEWSKRWFEILNDAVWCLVGLLNCFLLATPQGMILTVGLYLFDVSMAIVNYRKQIKQYKQLILGGMFQLKSAQQRLEKVKLGELTNVTEAELLTEIATINSYLDSLNDWKAYEVKRLRQSILVTVGLSVGMGISAIPIIAMLAGATLSGPWGLVIPLLAASIVLAICIAQFITSKQIEKQKPETDIKEMGNLKTSLTIPIRRKASVADLGLFSPHAKSGQRGEMIDTQDASNDEVEQLERTGGSRLG